MPRFAALLALGCMAALSVAAAGAQEGGYLRLEGHGGPIKGVAVSADGTTALSASFDYSVGIWSLETGQLLRWAEGHRAAANAVAFHPDGRRFLSVGDDHALIEWDLATGRLLRRFEGHSGKLLAVAVSPDGTLAATAGWDGAIGLWDLRSGERAGWLDGHGANINDVAFSADGRSLYSASYDGTIRQWDIASGTERARLVSHGFGVNHLELDEAAGWLAYGALDGTVRVLDLASGAALADLTADRKPILALALDPSGQRLAVGDGEGHIMVIETATWAIVRDFRAALRGPIWALGWAGSAEGAGARVLAGGFDEAAALWPVESAVEEALMASAEPGYARAPEGLENGERQFLRKCSICHTLETASGRRAGPSLRGIFGRRAGSLPDYRYSEALASSGIVWTDATIDRLFDEGPDHVTPGSKMPMQRIARERDRQDLIAYLRERAGPATLATQGEGQTQ